MESLGTEVGTVAIDLDRCIGSGQCIVVASGLFGRSDDGLAFLLPSDERGEIAEEDLLEAVRFCPSGALSLKQ